MKLDRIILFLFTGAILASCADLNYTEENTRDEDWTYEYFANGIKNMVFDVYAQLYNNEFESNSAYFLAGTTDDDPCSLFGRIRFPVEEFYPPDRLEQNESYRGLMQ